MSYQGDSIDWQAVHDIDTWLDAYVSDPYQMQPMAQDWARISKVIEELGESIRAFIGYTGQNPRKGHTNSLSEVLEELADTAMTAIFAMQHFTKDTQETRDILRKKIAKIESRMRVMKEQQSLPGVRRPDSEHGFHP